jgi:hypothetical protein
VTSGILFPHSSYTIVEAVWEAWKTVQ